MKFIKRTLATVVMLTMILSSVPMSAHADELETKTITFNELVKRVLDNNDTLDTLLDNQDKLGDALFTLESPYIHMASRGKGLNSSENSRDGIFYGYAKPIVIGKVKYQEQLAEVNAGINRLETTVNYQMQKSLVDLDYYQKLEVIYSKKADILKTKYNDTKLKYEKGLASKAQLDIAEGSMKMQQLGVEKLGYQVRIIKAKLAQAASLDSKYDYIFETPNTSSPYFTFDKFNDYLTSAEQTNVDLRIAQAKWDAIVYEGKVIEDYKTSVLKSDYYDFQRRQKEQEINLSTTKTKVRRTLTDLLNQVEKMNAQADVAEQKYNISLLDLNAAQINLKNGVIKPSDLTEFQLNASNAELTLAKANADRMITVKRLDTFVNFGVYVE